MSVTEEIRRRAEQVEEILKRYLPEETGLQKTVIEAANYSFLGGGKRLRPMLMQETYHMFGGEANVVEPFMAAIEMIHTYSLIHDDLPAMDDDDLRRGRATCHVRYGEAMAILAGDALLNLAFETALYAADLSPGDARVIRALQILAHSSGISGMLGGQAADVEAAGRPLGQETLDFIYETKTGALIEAAMLIGAVLAGAGEEDLSVILRVARDVGLAFQIRDDILDVTGSAPKIGKPIGSDEKNGKTTYVTLKGLTRAGQDARELTDRALAALDGLAVHSAFLTDLIGYLAGREK